MWNFEESFKKIDVAIGQKQMNNPIFNSTGIQNYIEASFNDNDKIKRRELLIKKAEYNLK